MKVVLESKLEKRAWKIMMEAQRKWKRNYGSRMCDHLDFYFEDIYRDEADRAVKNEVERRLREKFGKELFFNKDEYVKVEMAGYAVDELTDAERQELERELGEDYEDLREQIDDEREYLLEDVRQKLKGFYYTFFNSPQRLTVIYDGKVIQGGDYGQGCEA